MQNQTDNLRKIAIATANLVEHKILTKINLEASETLPTSTKIAALTEIITECSNFITSEAPFKNTEPLSSDQLRNLDLIQTEIIKFIGQNPDILKKESSLDAIPLSDISAISETESQSLKKDSLLYNLAGIFPNQFNIKIFNSLLRSCGPLNDRDDLLLTMFENRIFTSDIDMSETFDILAEKWLPFPSEAQMDLLINDHEFNAGRNAGKIAKSFFCHQHEDSALICYVLQNSQNTQEKRALQTYLTSDGIHNISSFSKHINCLVEANDNALLETALAHRESTNFLRQSEDHCTTLNLAVQHKFTKTFDMLIDAGFNPSRHPPEFENPIALACQNQSRIPLESYLNSIEKKHGADVAKDLINEVFYDPFSYDRRDRSALTCALEGKAYIDAIQLLLNRGANYRDNYLSNLEICISNGHAGALDLLINKLGPLETNDLQQLNKMAKTAKDPVIDSVLLSYVTTFHPENAELSEEITRRHASASSQVDPQELFRICQNGSEMHLQNYITSMAALNSNYTLSGHINEMDKENNKTPLYYAINNNAYDRLIKRLLENGANVNLIGYDNEAEPAAPINALSFAITKKQSATLKTLLHYGEPSPETLLTASNELVKPENNNALLTSSFVENLTDAQLVVLPTRSRQVLLKRSLESNLDRSVEKIKDSFAQTPEVLTNYIDDLFLESIRNSDNKMLTNLLDKFPATIQSFSSPSSSNLSVETSPSETSSLLRGNNGHRTPNSSINSSASNISRLSDSHKKYLDAALDAGMQAPSEKEENAKTIIKTLQKEGFVTSKTREDYKRIMVTLNLDDSQWYCPTDYNICRVM